MTRKDFKLFLTLVLWTLIPSIYTIIRMNIVAVSNVDINILGQMEWFDLIDEVITTTLTIPLYYLLKPSTSDKVKNGSAFMVAFGIYALFTVIVALNVGNIAKFMEAEYASRYLFLQSISMLINFASSFAIILFTLHDKTKLINIMLLSRIAGLIIFDVLLIPKYADIGASYSEIITNLLITAVAIALLFKHQLVSFKNMSFGWMISWIRIGAFSGIQIFLDNFFYAIMICKMVNAVNASGNYWVANNFIWGWLLVPVLCMSTIIQRNNTQKLTFRNAWCYCLIIAAIWAVTVPGWKPFLTHIMAVDAETILPILLPLVLYYLAYIPSALIDSWFVSKGKVFYNTLNSLLMNVVYYGIAFILFQHNVFELNINFIVNLFGLGMVGHLLISVILYLVECRKHQTTAVSVH